jgi:hypothetical protein
MGVGLQHDRAVASNGEPSMRARTVRWGRAVLAAPEHRMGMASPACDAENPLARPSWARCGQHWAKPGLPQQLSDGRSRRRDDRVRQLCRAARRNFTECLPPDIDDYELLQRQMCLAGARWRRPYEA